MNGWYGHLSRANIRRGLNAIIDETRAKNTV
jgi:hypothetical protein